MADKVPLKLATGPDEVAEFVAGDVVDPDHLGTGARTGGKFLRDDSTWVAISGTGVGDVSGPSSSLDEVVARFDGVSGKTLQDSVVSISDAGAITGVASIALSAGGTVDGRELSTDGAKLDGIAAGAELNTASNVAITAPHGIGRGPWKDKIASDLRFRPIVRGRQVSVPTTGDDIVVAFEAQAYAPHVDLPRPYRARGQWIAGATEAPGLHGLELVANDISVSTTSTYASPAGSSTDFVALGVTVGSTITVSNFVNGANNGAHVVTVVARHLVTVAEVLVVEAAASNVTFECLGEHLHPFQVATALDYETYPHDRHQRMESNLSSGNNSMLRGYEAGDFIAAGDALALRRIVYEQSGFIQNAGWTDAFIEHVLEPNPNVKGALAARYTGSNRMRMLSGELGLTWSGARKWTCRVELIVESATSYYWNAHHRIYGSDGSLVWEKECGGSGTSFNWATTDATLQLRWRVDRIANLDTYADTYQGSTNQGANTLRLDVREQSFLPGGFAPWQSMGAR